MQNLDKNLTIRDAVEADIAALTEIKGAGSETVHSYRLKEARAGNLRYLVLLLGEELIGCGGLVILRSDTPHLPLVDDLEIKERLRG